MTALEIINNLRAFVTIDQRSNTELMVYINKWYKKIYNIIVNDINENYFSTTSLFDAVADQESYTITKPTSSTSALSNITAVYIKLKNQTTYKKARYVDLKNNPKSLTEMLENNSSSEPSYWITETELYILPKFTESSTESGSNEQIKVVGIASAIDLNSSSVESDIVIPVDYHYLIELGALIEIYRYKKQIQEKNDAYNEFMTEKRIMISNLSGKVQTNDNISVPDDTCLQY